jgi:uncharacterized protein (DUF2141 family)
MFANLMKQRTFSFLLLLPVAWVLLLTLFSPGCANIVPPLGGPRDSFPPVLIKASPGLNATRFDAKTITLQFDEYLQLDNLQQELIINPPSDKQPNIEARLRNIYIKIRDTLQPNTTYSFRFGNAIRDINEGNALKSFSYVFSTGDYIDSLILAGVVMNAETGMPDSTLVVMLHKSADDSAVAKEKPQFITRPNGKGRFVFENLPPGSFYLFALKDEGMRRYSSNQTPFAFHGEQVNTAKTNDSILLRSFVAEKEVEKKPGQAAGGATGMPAKKKDEKPVLRITASASKTQDQDLLSPLTFTFSLPIKSFDSSLLRFSDTNNVAIKNYTLELDTSATKLVLTHAWKDDSYYKIIYPKNFASDSAGNGNARGDTILFSTKKESEYGAVRLTISGIDFAKKPLLQWVQNDAVVKSYALTGNKLNIPLLAPGEYKLRVLYDENGNGKWDTGNYWKKKQPEYVLAVDQKINIRPNWENEITVEL